MIVQVQAEAMWMPVEWWVSKVLSCVRICRKQCRWANYRSDGQRMNTWLQTKNTTFEIDWFDELRSNEKENRKVWSYKAKMIEQPLCESLRWDSIPCSFQPMHLLQSPKMPWIRPNLKSPDFSLLHLRSSANVDWWIIEVKHIVERKLFKNLMRFKRLDFFYLRKNATKCANLLNAGAIVHCPAQLKPLPKARHFCVRKKNSVQMKIKLDLIQKFW